MAVFHLYYLRSDISALAIFLPLSLGILSAAHFVDYFALRGTPINRLSKVAHVSLFANILWLMTILLGIAADSILGKVSIRGDIDYVVAGMFLAAGLRAGIFTSVFGAGLARAILVSFLQPLIFLGVILLPNVFILQATGIGFGILLYLLGISWIIVADRAARPVVKSTFGLLQAFLAAWSENKVGQMEEFIEARSHEEEIVTRVLKFIPEMSNLAAFHAAIVLPDVHPGPFSMVGGSNLPYVLYRLFSNKALILHGVSDHSLNIPSRREVQKYTDSLETLRSVERGNTCCVPSQVRVRQATSTGIAFGKTAILMISLAPKGMDDIPYRIREELESYGQNIGFANVLVIDCHNAMGKNPDESYESDIISSAKNCLGELKTLEQRKFKIGYANLEDTGHQIVNQTELAQAGIGVLVISVGGQECAFGWADSNNMENKLRDYILSNLKGRARMLEVCTSDTHSTSGKRTTEGYFALGTTESAGTIAAAFGDIAEKAAGRTTECYFDLASATSKIKVMGRQQFEDYSTALNKSMDVTKVFLGFTVAAFAAMLIFS